MNRLTEKNENRNTLNSQYITRIDGDTLIGMGVDKLAEYEQAESEKRLIILAMPDRAQIYIPIFEEYKVFKTHIEHRNTQFKNGKARYCVIVSDSMGMIMCFTDDDINKTVFLNLEGAEKALKENENN